MGALKNISLHIKRKHTPVTFIFRPLLNNPRNQSDECLHNTYIKRIYEVVLESSWTVIVVTVSVKEDERGCQGHTSKSLLRQSAMWHCTVNMHCLYKSAFSTLCFVFSAMDGKIEQRDCIKFCMKLSTSTTKPLKCFMRLLENIL
jgi:hypothetical protein